MKGEACLSSTDETDQNTSVKDKGFSMTGAQSEKAAMVDDEA